ncbi:MAG: flagellar export chaperone FlgN [Clostridium sp.]|nr:flagellar export chaperone FlgN [Clostridium sp.]
MITENIEKLENIIDTEIKGYKNIEKLYADKKEILIHGKGTDLFAIDEKITDEYKNISSCAEARKNLSKTMNIPTFSMTDIINNLKETDAIAAKKFEEKRETVNKLAHRIFELEKTNLELLKHGMHVTNRTLEIIIKGLQPITKEYNQKGQNITKNQLEMSSIIEEA